ncbi:B3 domain-containing protein REM9-like isoform X2 [Tasmannia lanceolata]|uniref:B3 domain-containing protein REM9-like isoform X2 n=1 Tax=Tasmannia lanceolata TaxID=3420 RepID=UPI004062EBF0
MPPLKVANQKYWGRRLKRGRTDKKGRGKSKEEMNFKMNDVKVSSDREMNEKCSHQPQFLKPIFPEFFHKISIPIAFHRFLVGEKSDIAVLKSPLGKSWPVKVKGRINGVFFEEGWEDFVTDHGLCSGDILVFRYDGNMVFHVTVFDKTACNKRYEQKMKNQRKIKDEKHEEASKGGQKEGFERSCSYKCPHFVATIKSYNLNGCMNIPKGFVLANNNFFNRTKITLKDPKRRSFPVTIYHKKCSSATYFSGGWRSFTTTNKLEKGDECIFELVAEDVMNVRISRR